MRRTLHQSAIALLLISLGSGAIAGATERPFLWGLRDTRRPAGLVVAQRVPNARAATASAQSAARRRARVPTVLTELATVA